MAPKHPNLVRVQAIMEKIEASAANRSGLCTFGLLRIAGAGCSA